MISQRTIEIARALSQPVAELDALLVPLAHGARDSNGLNVGNDAEAHTRMVAAMDSCRIAFDNARIAIAKGG